MTPLWTNSELPPVMKQHVDTECYHQGLEKSDNTTKCIFIKLWSFTDSQALRVRPKEETWRGELIIYTLLFSLVHMPFIPWRRSKKPGTQANKCCKKAEKSARCWQFHMAGDGELEFRVCKALKTRQAKIQEKAPAESPRNSERSFWKIHGSG